MDGSSLDKRLAVAVLQLGVRAHHHNNLKSKQLANVLIKILGLSVLVHGIPSIITGLFSLVQVRGVGSRGDYFWLYPLSSVVLVAIGVYLIVKSRDVTACLFKDEDE